ncbi:MBL fold metallo-hydrolase [Amycolatopsis thermoflava]|uniref:MBL fold metallo-hydrolase n=1 Tax=Amycolatopsis thermoflava TaxID=84480 RepID=UPI000480E5EB|nr:MBL fold metallo-hydrolase [Amycolatopsis thermoflava]
MKVHHLNCGTMRPLGGRLIDGRGGFLHRAELVCHCLLVDTGAELVLIETGMGSPAVDRADEWLGAKFVRMVGVRTSVAETAAEQVRRLGYDVEDVRHIVLTHLDLDHAGGLVDFPHATVHVYAEELRALQSPRDAKERLRYKQVHFAHGPQWSSYPDTGEEWFGFGAVRELKGLPPEILLVPLGGHTRGHAGVAVDTGDGWLLHAGDAFFHHGQIDPFRPHATRGLAWFEARVETVPGARRENHRRLRELVRDHGDEVTVLSAHDPWFLKHASRTS